MYLTIKQLTHWYATPRGELLSLGPLSFDVPDGQFAAVLGPSGCGKSTLLRLLAGLLEVSSGEIRLGDLPPKAAQARKAIAWMNQEAALLPWRNALENIRIAQQLNPQADRCLPSAASLLTQTGLAGFEQARPGELSGGMRQRLAFCRTLALDAPLWLLDEPFASLDELTRLGLEHLVLETWRSRQATVVWITHSVNEAIRLAQRLILLSPRPGRLLLDLPNPLGYPRREAAPAFQELASQVRAALGISAEALV